jgi:UDP-N-acetyl-2-amino-2-deoxyglucuronate dehydrogenase
MHRFGLIGAAGYIAPKHMRAIKDTGNDLVSILDPNDSVGIIDSHFPEASYFSEFERFDRHLDRSRRMGKGVDYISIASPNYLHDSHMRFALKTDAHAICEKPLVMNPYALNSLKQLENETGKRVYPILQLRLHPSIVKLKKKIEKSVSNSHQIVLDYVTPRGKWYNYSWKGNHDKSGGVATNIGIHFFDMLLWIFGPVQNSYVDYHTDTKASGHLELERANVQWRLSIDANDIPRMGIIREWKAYRSITIDGKEIEFSDGFTDLHTESYKNILNGNGFTIDDAEPSLKLVHQIRNSKK